MARERWHIKSSLALIFTFVALAMAVRRVPVNQNGYLMIRFGTLTYNLNFGTRIERIYGPIEGVGWVTNNPNLFQGWYQYPLISHLLGVTSTVTGLNVFDIIFLPIIPVGTIIAVYYFSWVYFRDFRISMALVAVVFLRFSVSTRHMYPKRFGRYVFFFFVLVLLYRYLESNRPWGRLFSLLLLFYLAVKFTSPKTETVVFISVVTLWAVDGIRELLNRDGFSYSEKPIGTVTAMMSVIFFSYNPKYYNALLGNLLVSTGPVSIKREDGSLSILDQLLELPHRLINLITSSSVSPNHPLMYTGGYGNPIERYVSLTFYLIISAPIFIYALYILYNWSWEELFEIKNIIIISAILGGIANLLYRLALLERLSLIFLFITLPIFSFHILSAKTEDPRILNIFIILIIITSGATAAFDLAREPKGSTIKVDQERETASWIYERGTGGRLYSGHLEFSEIYYFHGSRGASHPQLYLNQIRYTTNSYTALINGSANLTRFDYFLVKSNELDDPISQGKPRWRKFIPLEENMDRIVYNSKLNKIYSSGNTELYQ